MKPFCILFMLIGISFTQEESEDQYLVCKPLERNAPTAIPNMKLDKLNQGPVLRGPPGPPGRPGPPGESFNLDLFRNQLDLQILDQVVRIFFSLKCYDGVLIDGYCYRLLYRVGFGLTHKQARDMCEFQNGTLAELIDRRTFNAVYQYLQASWSHVIGYENERTLKVWLGSIYVNEMLLTKKREKIDFNLRWAEGFPIKHSSYQNVALEVAIKPSTRRDGLINIYSSYQRPIPLCQFDINTYKNFVGLT